MSASSAASRGTRLRPQGEGGFDECWYPIAPSSAVAAGEVVGVEFMDGRVALYRGEGGKARVLSAYCRHLGADLAVGRVEGDDLRCAFHRWKYDPEGKCNEIPSGDKIPAGACLFAFPSVEQLGLIWAFNGDSPDHDPPRFQIDESELAIRVSKEIRLPVDPWTLLTNSMDFQHLRVLHGLIFEKNPDDIEYGEHSIEYDVSMEDPKLGMKLDQHIRVTGTNSIALSGEMGGAPLLSMFSGRPVPGGSSGWTVTATRKSSDESGAQQVEAILAMGEGFFLGLIEEDEPVMKTIRFREDLMVESDAALVRFLKYLRSYPRSHVARDFIS